MPSYDPNNIFRMNQNIDPGAAGTLESVAEAVA